MQVLCPISANSVCFVYCGDQSYACSDLIIYGSTDANIHLNCYHGSCSSIKIHGEDADSINFVCTGTSCSSSAIYATNVRHLDIWCKNDEDSTYNYYNDYVCYAMEVQAKHAQNANIICDGYKSCYSTNIYLDSAIYTNIKASGKYALDSSTVYTDNATFTNITCIGQPSYYYSGCYDSNLYINPSNTMLNCYGYGCYSFDLHSSLGFAKFTQISLVGNDQCSSIDSCISDWELSGDDCGSDSYWDDSTTFYGSYCSSDYDDNCGCTELSRTLQRAWNNPSANKCSINISCDITCGDDECSSMLIEGSNATSLSLECSSTTSCKNSFIYCPSTIGSKCSIICSSTDACSGMQITAYTNIIDITCEYENSCTDMVIDADNVQSLTLKCNYDASYYSDGTCKGLYLNAEYIESVDIICDGGYSCYELHIDTSHANTMQITANEYDQALYGATIHAEYTAKFDLECRGSESDDDYWSYNSNQGCSDTKLYLPQNDGEFNLHCKGTGCESLSLYSDAGMSVIDSISFDLCGCNSEQVDSCMSSWNLYCNSFNGWDSDNYYGSYDSYTFYGSYCSDWDDSCNCQTMLNKLNDGISHCNTNDTNKLNVGQIIAITIGVTFGTICLLSIYCRLCGKKGRRRRRRRRQGEGERPQNQQALVPNVIGFNEGGNNVIQAQEIALQPMAEEISYIPLNPAQFRQDPNARNDNNGLIRIPEMEIPQDNEGGLGGLQDDENENENENDANE